MNPPKRCHDFQKAKIRCVLRYYAKTLICYRKLLHKLNDTHFVNGFRVCELVEVIHQKWHFKYCDFSLGACAGYEHLKTPTHSHARVLSTRSGMGNAAAALDLF